MALVPRRPQRVTTPPCSRLSLFRRHMNMSRPNPQALPRRSLQTCCLRTTMCLRQYLPLLGSQLLSLNPSCRNHMPVAYPKKLILLTSCPTRNLLYPAPPRQQETLGSTRVLQGALSVLLAPCLSTAQGRLF